LTYIGEIIVNGNPILSRAPGDESRARSKRKNDDHKWTIASEMRQPAPVPQTQEASGVRYDPGTGASTRPARQGTRDKLQELGPDKFSQWILDQKRLLITDTTFRDAHQSLLATRMRTYDMLKVAPVYAAQHAALFSLEMWGGATFDSAMRFLKESPWDRLADLRAQIPNILFQMLLRAANAVGYTNYPDNVVRAFVTESAQAGIDLFRIFDALNWVPNLRPAMEAVLQAGKLCEGAICYTGDILDANRPKYDLKYYVSLAKELEKLGAHILAIKDMAGLCKPYAAKQLVRALKQEVGIPIHFHTHDCAGGQMAAILMASEEKVDIADAAMAPLSGLTSQPNLNSLVEALRFTHRDTGLSYEALQATAEYWEAVRRYYLPFESGQQGSSADVYRYEMPGGQYTNLHQQAQALGLESRWPEVCRMYAEVNRMFGDIIKVTPTSKVVGDMALFMVANNLTPEEVVGGKRELAFPESVVEFFEGRLGQPPGGFPKELQKRVLRGRKPSRGRPGANLPPADFDASRVELEKETRRTPNDQELLSYLLYPRVFPEFAEHQKTYSDTSVLPTPVFFYGMEPGEEVSVDIEQGKTLIIKFLTVGDPHPDGKRLVFFELNGQPREVLVEDRSLGGAAKARPKAEPSNPHHVAAPMPGLVVSIAAAPGEKVAAGQKLCVLEAMKMETTLYAEKSGKIAELLVQPGTQVEAGDLLMRLE
jgi:pyruvate carboxylase